MTTRWPLHPAPVPGEALTSWLYRLADPYGLDVAHLLFDLGFVLDCHTDLDVAAPEDMVHQLALRTGVDAARIRMMSLSGYTPWLTESIGPVSGSFTIYTRQLSVLVPDGRLRHREVDSWQAWSAPAGQQHRRLCPQCVVETAPPRPYQLMWSLSLMLTCPRHRCWLEHYEGSPGYYFWLDVAPPSPRPCPVDHPVTIMDSRTWQALSCGYVDLPRYRVHAGLWFRLLRTLIDELGATTTECGAAQRLTRTVWEHAGYPMRAGQWTWRPYERLSTVQQQQTLETAATAMHLVETSALTGQGSEAAVFLPEPDASIDPGPPREDKTPLARSWQAVQDSFNASIEKARHDPETARDLFRFMTYGHTDEKSLHRVRDTFALLSIPLEFLSH